MSAAAPNPVVHGVDVRLLELLSHGFTEEMIGLELGLTAEGVRASIRDVARSLGARNREHAVALALESGLIR
jgi:DNA-binding NarL/FixJ family response regulator